MCRRGNNRIIVDKDIKRAIAPLDAANRQAKIAADRDGYSFLNALGDAPLGLIKRI